MASRHVYDSFLKHNVKVYEYQKDINGKPQALHSKTVVVDGIFSSIGSSNLDLWSFSWNLEVNLTTPDLNVANKLREYFMNDLTRSEQITSEVLDKQSFIKKFINWVVYKVLTTIW